MEFPGSPRRKNINCSNLPLHFVDWIKLNFSERMEFFFLLKIYLNLWKNSIIDNKEMLNFAIYFERNIQP